MPLVDLRCSDDACRHRFEYYRPLAHWDDPLPPCEICNQSTYQSLDTSYRRNHQSPDAVVVFKAPDGSFRFPGDPNGLSAANYARSGFTRLELRSAADVRRFESTMNKQEYARAERRIAQMQQMRSRRESINRGNLRAEMQHFSRFGRDVARTAMDRNDAKPGLKARESGFFVDVYSNNRTNRDESRDDRGRRRRD